MCDSQQDMSNWIGALTMARALCDIVFDPSNNLRKHNKQIGDQPDGNQVTNDATISANNSPHKLPAEGIFQEAMYQQALDRIWNRTFKVNN